MTQMPYFNLLDEPWLPVSLGDEKRVVRVGLLDAFTRSSEISLLAETAPPSLVAEYRVLLAILHRALSAAFPNGWKDKDRVRWYREGLPVDSICAYLEKWKERFWLFHPEYPFMQVAALATSQELGDEKNHKPWMQIAIDCPDANSPVIFDHSYYDAPSPLSPHKAVSYLLGYSQFAPPGGTLRVLKESQPSKGAGKGGPLRKAAALVALGDNLSETLLLNLGKKDSSSDRDLPAWEKVKPELATLAKASLATGLNDQYTRQTRAILFLRESDGYIKRLLFASGLELLNDHNFPDPMVIYDSKNNFITFKEGRTIWRDLPVLAAPKSGASVLNNALHLHEANGIDSVTFYQPVLLMGMASGESGGAAKNARWRSERLEIPLSVKEDYDTHDTLSELVGKSEKLHVELKEIAGDMSASSLTDPDNKNAFSEARNKFKSGNFEASYFSTLEKGFPRLMDYLRKGNLDAAVENWNELLRVASQQAWQQLKLSMGFSSRSLRAQAKFAPQFYGVLKKFCAKPQPEKGVSV